MAAEAGRKPWPIEPSGEAANEADCGPSTRAAGVSSDARRSRPPSACGSGFSIPRLPSSVRRPKPLGKARATDSRRSSSAGMTTGRAGRGRAGASEKSKAGSTGSSRSETNPKSSLRTTQPDADFKLGAGACSATGTAAASGVGSSSAAASPEARCSAISKRTNSKASTAATAGQTARSPRSGPAKIRIRRRRCHHPGAGSTGRRLWARWQKCRIASPSSRHSSRRHISSSSCARRASGNSPSAHAVRSSSRVRSRKRAASSERRAAPSSISPGSSSRARKAANCAASRISARCSSASAISPGSSAAANSCSKPSISSGFFIALGPPVAIARASTSPRGAAGSQRDLR